MVRKRGFMTKKDGQAWLADQQSAGRKGEYVEPSKQRFGSYGAEVIDGLRVGPQTKASYVKNWRNHIAPYPIAAVPLAQLTGTRLTAHYRVLEKSGRKDHKAGEPLVGADGALPAHDHPRRARPGREGRPAAAQPGRRGHAADRPGGEGAGDAPAGRRPARRVPGMGRGSTPRITPLWHVLAYTGMRRGEALALRWRDVDLDAATVSVRRSAGMVRIAGKSRWELAVRGSLRYRDRSRGRMAGRGGSAA